MNSLNSQIIWDIKLLSKYRFEVDLDNTYHECLLATFVLDIFNNEYFVIVREIFYFSG